MTGRYSTAGMALVAAEQLTERTGRTYRMVFAPRYLGDFQPFIVTEELPR